MRWGDGRQSDNVEDRRGVVLRRGVGIGGGAAVLALVAALLGAPREIVDMLAGGGGQPQVVGQRPVSPEDQPVVDFVKLVLGDTEDVWDAIFTARNGASYERPHLVLFTDEVDSACGMASAAVGPFYCPRDHKVYLDLSFFRELDRKFGAPGDFAQAYVIAHEVGHHVQVLTGVSERVTAAREQAGEAESNQLSVRLELQADCLAGVWAHHTAKMHDRLDPGDIDEGLRAASAIGDDTLQRRARGRVVPETFTHGSSAQRVHWFRRGFDGGRIESCDTFAGGPR
jgi:predicted metalloprotease